MAKTRRKTPAPKRKPKRKPRQARLSQYDVFPLMLKTIYYDSDFNCRGQFTIESVYDLAQSIKLKGGGLKLKGLDFPVVVQSAAEVVGGLPDGFDYRLIAGHRRFRAVEFFLKWASIPAMVRHLSDHEARMLNFTENLERQDLNILQEARAVGSLYPEGVTLRLAADELKRPTRWVHIRLRLLTMPEAVQQHAAAGLLSAVNIEALAGLETPEDQIVAAGQIVLARSRGNGINLPGLEEACKRNFQYRKSKQQIADMVARMLDAGISGLPTRALAWSAGQISDKEFQKDFEHSARRKLL